MILFGSLKVKGPDLLKGDHDICYKSGDGDYEFYLHTDQSKKPDLGDFSLSVMLDEDKEISFSTDYEGAGDFISIEIESKNKKESIGLSLNADQARILRDILEHFTNAYYSIKALSTKRTVKAV